MYGEETTQVNAKWIWHMNDVNPINQWIILRKKIQITGDIKAASLIVTADARYWAYINSSFISR